MAHFAKLNAYNIVEQVIVVANEDIVDENGNESEDIGVAFCNDMLPGRWVQTSYNGSFRKNYAGIGYMYSSALDAFIPPRPAVAGYNFVFDESTCRWARSKITE